MRPAAHGTALAALLALVLAAGSARADGPGDLQIAQALYNSAAKDMLAKDYAAACPKLEEAARLVPSGIGVRLLLASCYEGQGRLASASAAYELAEAQAARGHEVQRQREAHGKAAALAPRLAKLRIVVTDEVRALPGLEIRRGESLVGPAQWGLLLPADKGKHVVAVTTSDGRRWEASAVIEADGSQVDLRVELPKAEPQQALAPRTEPVPVPTPTPATAPMHPRRIAGIVVGATGVAAIVTGAALGISAIVDKNRSNGDGRCTPTGCSTDGADLRWASLRAGDWSTAMFIGGGIALAGGVALFVTAPATAPEKRPAAATLVLGPRGLAVSGAW